MIRLLMRLGDDRTRASLTQLLVLIVASAVLQGIAFVLLVPFLGALFASPLDPDAVWRSWWWLAGVGIAYAGLTWAGSLCGQKSAVMVLESLERRIGDRLIDLPLGWFGPERSGELSDVGTRGVVFAASAPYGILRPILQAFIVPATVALGTFWFDWRIALALVATAPVLWVSYQGFARILKRNDAEHNTVVAAASARIIEFARTQPAVRAAGSNSIAQRLVADALSAQHAVKRRNHIVGATGVSIHGVLVQLVVIVVMALGTYLTLGGELDVAVFLALLVLTSRFAEPVSIAVALAGGIGVARNTLEAIQRLLDTPTLPEPATPAQPADTSIRFDRVTFGYGGPAVLKNITFTVPAGTTTAIVGPSGSGKTTITRLVARFYDPEAGRVLIGGVPLPELGSNQVAETVAQVFQDVYLFDDTILGNIWIGRPDATREEVLAAGRLARVDEIVGRLPGGWDARVGEGGTNLSGGERQRVSIARALLKGAPIVLLDEATAALDAQNEEAIQEAIAEVSRHRTVLIVAHRLQTILSADQILMLSSEGTIAEAGTHEELLAAGGGYAHYWAERQDALGWRIGA